MSGEKDVIGADHIKTALDFYKSKKKDKKPLLDDYIYVPVTEDVCIVRAHIITKSILIPNYVVETNLSYTYKFKDNYLWLVYQTQSDVYYSEFQQTKVNIDHNYLTYLKQLLKSKSDQEKISLQKGTQSIYITPQMIMYAKADGHDTEIHGVKNSFLSTTTITKIKEKLNDDFYQIHRSYIVNTNYIHKIRCYEVELINGEKLPIPANKYGQIKKDLEQKIHTQL